MPTLNDQIKLHRADIYFLQKCLINPTNGKPYSDDLIQQVFYGNRNNELVYRVIENYFNDLKPEFLVKIKASVDKVYSEFSSKQKY